MGLAMVGVSHHDVSIAELEQLSRGVADLPVELVKQPHAGVVGAVLLSTCNRVEIYLDAADPRQAAEVVRELLAEQTGTPVPRPRLTADVPRHLFSVAAGLESMVVGEAEISGQVRRALADSRVAGTTSAPLERLFQFAAATSRTVSSTSGLGAAGRSIVTVGLDLVEAAGSPLDGSTALLVGTGSFANVSYAALSRRGCANVLVFSSAGRAQRFVESHGGTPIEPDGLLDALTRADVVVSCSGAPHAVLDAATLASATEERDRPLPILDLALTRDVDADARALAGVTVIDLDAVAANAPAEHADAVLQARQVVEEAVAQFDVRESERSADALIVAVREHVSALVERETARARGRLDPAATEAVESALHRLASELLHGPTIRAREFTREGLGDDYERAIRMVFGIEPPRP